MDKAPDAFRTISEVADDLDIPQHVLRFWETRFSQIRPMKRSGGRRYYRPDDVDLLRGIRRLLYGEGYTIRGVQRILKEQGIKAVQGLADETVPPASLARRAHPAGDHDDDAPPEAHAEEPDDAEEYLPEDDAGEDDDTPPAPPVRPSAAVLPRVDVAPRGAARAVRPPAAARVPEPAATAPAKALPDLAVARLTAALDDLTACKQLIDEALKGSPPELFPRK